MTKPLISDIIPTYNHAHFLGEAIESVLRQLYTNWELLIIDNHSEDNTDEVIASFSDSRIRTLKIHNDGVIAASRNMGIIEAKGEWIAFLDSDDIWYNQKLSTVIDLINKYDQYDVISTDEYIVENSTGKRKGLKYGPYRKDFYKEMLVNGNKLSTSATVVRSSFMKERSLLFNVSKSYITVEDYDLWLNLARHEAKFYFIPKFLGEYNIHSSNSSGQLVRHHNSLQYLLNDHVYNIQKFNMNPDKLWSLIEPRLKFMESMRYYSEKKIGSAILLFFKSFFENPISSLRFFCSFLKGKLL
jgi:glycosyltransferase involved in cell wall biosynthesis